MLIESNKIAITYVIARSNGTFYRGEQFNKWVKNIADAKFFNKKDDITLVGTVNAENKFGDYPVEIKQAIISLTEVFTNEEICDQEESK